ncbi:hypothetical protein [Runella sp.]|uniref:hypothetical protein n=1 Tax=Runella sp. TaxID=1960881 RepID=UPI003018D462
MNKLLSTTLLSFVLSINLFGFETNYKHKGFGSLVVTKSKFTEADIAKYAISTIMSQPTKIISVKKKGTLFLVSYTRRNDGEYFSYRVKIDGNKVIWASIDGRWRDRSYDDTIIFKEIGGKIMIHQIYTDGSDNIKYFTK